VALSVGKLDHEGMTGGSILNIKFMPTAVAGEKGLKNFASYVKGALEAGVWHVQFNVVDSNTLRDAQVHAEKYPDLLVRVAGYSAFFTGLSRPLQEDVIGRAEHCRCQ
jgi:formate C-acetyltransferase